MSGDNPRTPNSLPALLNVCVRNTSEDAPNNSAGEMDPEVGARVRLKCITVTLIIGPTYLQRRKWLDEALASMTVSPVEEMQKNLKMIRDTLNRLSETSEEPTDDACGTIQSGLDVIIEYSCSIDCAKGEPNLLSLQGSLQVTCQRFHAFSPA